mmetsp:Transcript_6789/g.21171  ORF Transcript_6789/g.21171 Transcript_6789/m.21171 type:complete len:305 (-) Transcript_6789:74-988(-)
MSFRRVHPVEEAEPRPIAEPATPATGKLVGVVERSSLHGRQTLWPEGDRLPREAQQRVGAALLPLVGVLVEPLEVAAVPLGRARGGARVEQAHVQAVRVQVPGHEDVGALLVCDGLQPRPRVGEEEGVKVEGQGVDAQVQQQVHHDVPLQDGAPLPALAGLGLARELQGVPAGHAAEALQSAHGGRARLEARLAHRNDNGGKLQLGSPSYEAGHQLRPLLAPHEGHAHHLAAGRLPDAPRPEPGLHRGLAPEAAAGPAGLWCDARGAALPTAGQGRGVHRAHHCVQGCRHHGPRLERACLHDRM